MVARTKAFMVSATALALCAGPLAGVAHAAGSTIFVNGPGGTSTDANCTAATHTTIQSAVTDAASGDTISVCPATYTENVNDGGKSLTFLGAQHGVDARAPHSGGETIVNGNTGIPFTLSGSGSSLDGFELTGATSNVDTPGAFLQGTGEAVSNTIMTGNGNGATITGSTANFSRNLVESPAGGNPAGFFFNSGGGSNSTVANNAFSGDFTDAAINIADLGPTGNNIAITNNTLDASSGGNFVVAGGTRNLDITNNTVTGGPSDDNTGILMLGDDSGYSIDGNSISGIAGASAVSFAGGFGYPDNGGGDVTGNALTHNLRGVNANSDTDGLIDINNNIIVGNTSVGINVGDNPKDADTASANVKATDNYWGCNTGPNTSGCDTTTNTGTGTFTTSPFLVLSSTVGSSSVVSGSTTTFTADLNHDNNGNAISGHVLDNVETATFSFTGGGVSPGSAPIIGGLAHTTLTAGGTAGHFSATAHLENSSSSKPVTVTANPKPGFRIADASTVEGNSGTHALVFHVTLSKKALAGGASVQYTTVQGSATAGSDYISKSGTLTIPAGKTTGTISILIKGDKQVEPNESFIVSLFSAKNSFVADPNGTGVIRNDDK
jgi:hypothetical protein